MLIDFVIISELAENFRFQEDGIVLSGLIRFLTSAIRGDPCEPVTFFRCILRPKRAGKIEQESVEQLTELCGRSAHSEMHVNAKEAIAYDSGDSKTEMQLNAKESLTGAAGY